MKKILLLGSGELGKEFVIACERLGQYVVACDSYDNAPAMQVADERRIFSMLDGEALMKVVAEVNPDIIGGFILEYDTYRMHASVKSQLNSILKKLK